MLFDQIGTHNAILGIPYMPSFIGLFIFMGILDLLLALKLIKDLEVDQAGVKLFPKALVVLESKAHISDNLLGLKGHINARVLGPILHSTKYADCQHKLLNALFVQATEGMRGFITLLIYNGIDGIIAQAQGNKYPGNRSPVYQSIHCLMLLGPWGT